MAYSAKILADSINPVGNRLTTMEVTYPLCVHAEHLRHRMFSFNVASARAIPIKKIIDKIETDMFYPVYYGKNKSGMSADEELTLSQIDRVNYIIEAHRDATILMMEELNDVGLHKQISNRYAAPFSYVTVIKSGTEWTNFFNLRSHEDAQPEIKQISDMMKELYYSNTPEAISAGGWHIPMCPDKIELFQQGYSMEQIRRIAVGRLCRISYLTHSGIRDPQEDLALAQRIQESGHWSPFEHVAQASNNSMSIRNYKGWAQQRAFIDGQ